MAEAQQGAYENYQIVAQAQALEIMFLDSLRVGQFRIAEITSGLTNAKIMAIVKDGDTSPVPDTFNTRQEAVNYCVQQIQAQSQADTLYILTVSGDLAEYYDSQQGEGAWDALTADDQATIVRSVQRALDGFMEDREIAFDAGITDSGIA